MRSRPATRIVLAIALVFVSSVALAADFELEGQLQPNHPLPVHLQGATAPFSASTQANLDGKFRFRKVPAGTYILAVDGLQRTVEVSPGLADTKRRIHVVIELGDRDVAQNAQGHDRVSAAELSIPKQAVREYQDAERALGQRDGITAAAHLRRAVELAPQFSAAWNYLGTIAYQAGKYEAAAADFRKALEADPDAYAPLVNLGGVLLNLSQWQEALALNQRAVSKSPSDALANSQLGMAYFYSGQFALAEKYLTAAKRLDPSHFSHPQLVLAEIDLRRNQPAAAADELQDLLARHPDLPNAATIKQEIVHLRQQAP